MALSATKIICIICVLSFFSVQIHARESQFFVSKVPISSNSNNYVQVTPNNNNNKEEQSLSKQEPTTTTSFAPVTQKTATTLNKQQQEPSFIPETQNAYGLYGHENNHFPTTTSAADVKYYEPYTTPITSTPTGTFEPYTTTTTTPTTTITTSAAVKYEPYTTPITSYNNNGFETEQESLGDSKFQESGYTSNNVEKQGISDTRFLEKGKYYYDVKNENNYYPNQYQQQQNSRGYYNGNTNQENEFDELP